MKERCRDGCRTSLLIAGVVLVPAIFHTLLPPCHPYITIHFMEMIFFHFMIINRDDFNFKVVNFPFLCSNIPSGPGYGVYIFQLICIGRICSDYSSFALRHCKLTERLVHQGFIYSNLCKTFDKFARRHGEILDK